MDNLVTNNIEVSHQILTDGIVMDDSSEDPVSHDAIIDTYIPPEPEETTQTQKLSPDEAERGLQGIVQNIESAYAEIKSATSDSFVCVSAYSNLSINVPNDRFQISRMIAEGIQKQDMLFWTVRLRGTLQQIADDAAAALKLDDHVPDTDNGTSLSNFLPHKIRCLLSLLGDGFFLYYALSQADLDQGAAQQDAEFIRETLVTLNQKTHTASRVNLFGKYAYTRLVKRLIPMDRAREAEALRLIWSEPENPEDPDSLIAFALAQDLYTSVITSHAPEEATMEARILRKRILSREPPALRELSSLDVELYRSVIHSLSLEKENLEEETSELSSLDVEMMLDIEMMAIKSYGVLTPKIYEDEANQGLGVIADLLDRSLQRLIHPEDNHRSAESRQREAEYFKLTQEVSRKLMHRADTDVVVVEARRVRKNYEEVSSTNRFGELGQELGRQLVEVYMAAAPKIYDANEASEGAKFLRPFFEDEDLGQQAFIAYAAISNDVSQEAAGVEAKALRADYGGLDTFTTSWYLPALPDEQTYPYQYAYYELYRPYLSRLNPLDAAEEAHAHHEVITSSFDTATGFAETLSAYEICLLQMTQGLFETPALEDEASLLASTDYEAEFLRAPLMNEQNPQVYREGFRLYAILANHVSEQEAASAAVQFRSAIANGSTVDQVYLVDLYATLSPKLSASELSQGATLFRTEILSEPPLELRHNLAKAYSEVISLMPHAAQQAEYDHIRANFAHVSRIVRETFKTSYKLCVGKMPLETMAEESEKILLGLKQADKNMREISMDLTEVLYDNMTADLREEHGLKLVKTLDMKDDGLLQTAMTLCEKWFGDLRPQSYTRIAQELRILSADPHEDIADNAFPFFKKLFFKLSPDVQANEAKELHAFFGRKDSKIRTLVANLYAQWLKTVGPEPLRQQANSLFESLNDNKQVWEVKAFLYQKVLPRLMSGGAVFEQTRQLRSVFLSSNCESLVLIRSQEVYLAWIKSLNGEWEPQEAGGLRDFIKNPENILKRGTAVKAYRELAKTFESATVQSEMRMMREEFFVAAHPDIRTTGLVLYGKLATLSPPTSEEKMSAIIVLQEMAKDHLQVVRQAAKSAYDQLVGQQEQEKSW